MIRKEVSKPWAFEHCLCWYLEGLHCLPEQTSPSERSWPVPLPCCLWKQNCWKVWISLQQKPTVALLHHYIWLQRTQLWWSPWHLAVTNLKVMKHGLSPVPSNSFWLKLIKFELSLINIRYSVYRWYIPSSVSERESQVLLFEELSMSVSPPSSPWTARSLSASDELPLTLSFFRVRLSGCKETHKYHLKHLDYCFTRHSAYISNRNPTNWNVTWLYSSLFLITEFMKMELQTCV